MSLKDYLIAALLIAVLGLWFFRGGEKTPTNHLIQQARKDSVYHAKELSLLEGQISSLKEDLTISDTLYQQKLDSVQALKMPQIDSIFVERYNVTLTNIDNHGARLLMVDLLEGQHAIEQIKTYQRIVSSQAKSIRHLKGIIKTDSVQIINLRIENRKYKRQSTLVKVGAGVAAIGAILLLK